MSKPMQDIMQKRGALLEKIALQRDQVAAVAARWEKPLAVADQIHAAVNYLRARPLLVLGVVSLFAVRRSGVIGMASGAWRLWKLYKSSQNFAAKISSRF